MSLYKFTIRLSQKNELSVEEENLHPKAGMYKNGRTQLIVLGSPIYCGKIDNEALGRKLFEKGITGSVINELDGSFLIILHDESKSRLIVANDRFASIPFFYFLNNDGFMGSVSYHEIWKALSAQDDLAVNSEAFYEFIQLQRLLGHKTYDKKSVYMNSASILNLDLSGNNLSLDRYWRPNFNKKRRTDKENSNIFAELVSEAIRKRTGDNKRYGLLLSGGLDSRLVLGGFKKAVPCVTIGEYENNEYRVAKELASAKGCPHHPVKVKSTHYAEMLQDAVRLGGAMHMYSHAHFLNLESELKEIADVFFHGYGFDYMFRGKYLPCKNVRVFDKKTFIRRMMDINKDLKGLFLSNISYRLKSIDPLSLVSEKARERIKESATCSIGEILEEGRDCCNSAYDFWEYLVIHNMSRHYTFLNILSIRAAAEERTVTFDNQLFDFYLSLPAEVRLNNKVFTDTVRILDERLYGIRNSNTNFNIHDSDFMQTAKLAVNRILKRFGFDVSLPPKHNERSWPGMEDIISGNDIISKAAAGLVRSRALESIGFLDMEKVRYYMSKSGYSDVALTLITINAFLNDNEKC